MDSKPSVLQLDEGKLQNKTCTFRAPRDVRTRVESIQSTTQQNHEREKNMTHFSEYEYEHPEKKVFMFIVHAQIR